MRNEPQRIAANIAKLRGFQAMPGHHRIVLKSFQRSAKVVSIALGSAERLFCTIVLDKIITNADPRTKNATYLNTAICLLVRTNTRCRRAKYTRQRRTEFRTRQLGPTSQRIVVERPRGCASARGLWGYIQVNERTLITFFRTPASKVSNWLTHPQQSRSRVVRQSRPHYSNARLGQCPLSGEKRTSCGYAAMSLLTQSGHSLPVALWLSGSVEHGLK
jgi:hypothetical protein